MSARETQSVDRAARLHDAPALVLGAREAVIVAPSGEVETLTLAHASRRVGSDPHLYCHGLSVRRKLGLKRLPGYDAMELFAFARPRPKSKSNTISSGSLRISG